MKKIYALALVALMATPLFNIKAEEPENLYLVKDNRVIGKYDAKAVEYITFNLPEQVIDSPLWLTVDNVGKNTVTYTVSTQEAGTAYAHNIVSYYSANVIALSYYNMELSELSQDTFDYVMKLCLQSGAYVGMGTQTYTQKDYEDDGTGNEYYTSRFSVQPGTKYYLAVWEIDPVTQEAKDNIDTIEFTTLAPGQSPYKVNVECLGQNDDTLDFDFSGTSEELLYVTTAYGMKSSMESFVALYGLDYLYGSFGQNWDVEELLNDARWPAYDAGEYVLYCRGVDANGDIYDAQPVVATVKAAENEGPVINILNKSKGNNHVTVQFEITPSNVLDAYIYVGGENEVDDKVNAGYTLWDIAASPSSTDISYQINTLGEYTFDQDVVEQWTTMLIAAQDKDGNRSICRLNFYPDGDSYWSIINPAKAPAQVKATSFRTKASNPTIKK
ncbi:MAG: hypothetical protein NC217_05970 [Muribaculaceae bacterium]|nr:hypothetical protein [Muribaculaceae bacterium]